MFNIHTSQSGHSMFPFKGRKHLLSVGNSAQESPRNLQETCVGVTVCVACWETGRTSRVTQKDSRQQLEKHRKQCCDRRRHLCLRSWSQPIPDLHYKPFPPFSPPLVHLKFSPSSRNDVFKLLHMLKLVSRTRVQLVYDSSRLLSLAPR